MFLRKKEEVSLRPRKLIPLVKHSHHAAVKRFRTPAESSEKSNFKFLRTMRSGVRISPGRYIERLSLSEFAKVKPFFIGAGDLQLWPLYGPFGIKVDQSKNYSGP